MHPTVIWGGWRGWRIGYKVFLVYKYIPTQHLTHPQTTPKQIMVGCIVNCQELYIIYIYIFYFYFEEGR
jgi:hypothetical protein